MKKIILLILLLFPIAVYADDLAPSAESSILVEESTGKVLYEKNSNEKKAPASMTKVMTLLLIMEAIESNKIGLNDMVTISSNAASMGGSQVFLEANSQIKVSELIKSIAIASANDSAVALAETIGGTEEAFVNMMNKKATSLGCKNTNFVNVHGLDDDNHYTTAYDMSLMARELLKHPTILNYSNIYEDFLNKPDGTTTWMVNTNKLIKYYNGLDGLKTGFTSKAGYCITATAKRNDMRLISVVMKEPTTESRSNDTISLLNYGFSNYKLKTIVSKDKILGTIEIKNGKEKTVQIKLINNATNFENISDNNKYTYNITTKKITAPIKVGATIGYLEVTQSGKVISKFPLTVIKDIKKANIWDLYKRNLKLLLIGS